MAQIISITLVALLCIAVATPAKLTKELNSRDSALTTLENLNVRQEIENFILKSPGIVDIIELFNRKSNPEVSEVVEAFNRGIGFSLLTVKNGFVEADMDYLPFQRSIKESEVSLVRVPVIDFSRDLVQSRASIFASIYQTVCTTVNSIHTQLNSTLTTFLNNLKSIDIGSGNNVISEVVGSVLNVVLGLLQQAIALVNQLVETTFGSICKTTSRKRRDLEEADSLINFRGDIKTRLALGGVINKVLSIVGGALKVLVKILLNNKSLLIPIVLLIVVNLLF